MQNTGGERKNPPVHESGSTERPLKNTKSGKKLTLRYLTANLESDRRKNVEFCEPLQTSRRKSKKKRGLKSPD